MTGISLSTMRDLLDKARKLLTPTFLIGCIEAYPIMTEDEAPVAVQEWFGSHLDSFVTNNGRNIFFSLENAVRYFDDMRDREPIIDLQAVTFEIKNYLIREYSHLFLQHHRVSRYYNRDEFKKYTFQVATEIEAMRNNLIADSSDCFQQSATDKKFPVCGAAKHLKQIYQMLLDEFGNQIEEAAMAAGAPQEQGQQEGDSDGTGDKNTQTPASSSDGEGEDRENGDGDSMGANGSPEDTEGEGEGDSQKDSGGAPQSDSQKDSQSSQGKRELTDEQREIIKRMAKEAKDGVSPEDEGEGNGSEPGEGENTSKDINELLEDDFQRWGEHQLEKSFKNLRAAIRGNISAKRNPTYARPSRRMIGDSELLRKGVRRDTVGQPRILVALDQSGSMDITDVKAVANVIHNVFEELGRPMDGCYITRFDTRTHDTLPLKKWQQVVKRFSAGGGTDYGEVLALANELNVDVVIEVGDGCDDLRNYGERLDFIRANRKWYDVLVPMEARQVEWAWGHHIGADMLQLPELPRHALGTDPITILSLQTLKIATQQNLKK